MAKFECSDMASFLLSMQELAELPDDVLEDMLDAEADVIVAAQKNSAVSMGVYDTGEVSRSIAKGKAKRTSSGMSISVYPKGSRTRGGITTRNSEIAFINEFGKQGQSPRPFIQTGNERGVDSAVSAAADVYDDYLNSKNL